MWKRFWSTVHMPLYVKGRRHLFGLLWLPSASWLGLDRWMGTSFIHFQVCNTRSYIWGIGIALRVTRIPYTFLRYRPFTESSRKYKTYAISRNASIYQQVIFPETSGLLSNMAPKQFTMAEVSKHNTKDDLWVVVHDKVYDVTKFQLEVGNWPIQYWLETIMLLTWKAHAELYLFVFYSIRAVMRCSLMLPARMERANLTRRITAALQCKNQITNLICASWTLTPIWNHGLFIIYIALHSIKKVS